MRMPVTPNMMTTTTIAFHPVSSIRVSLMAAPFNCRRSNVFLILPHSHVLLAPAQGWRPNELMAPRNCERIWTLPRSRENSLTGGYAFPYTFSRWTRGDLRQLAPRKKLLKSRTSTQSGFFEPSPLWRGGFFICPHAPPFPQQFSQPGFDIQES